jgi:K319-like protein/parallel beta helix pectate lyase-like protein
MRTLFLPVYRRTAAAALVAVVVAATAVILGAGTATGAVPTVNAGADQTITVADRAFLNGVVSDDGSPEPSRLQIDWSAVSGPGTVTIARRDEAHTSATFSAAGSYVLRLSVNDGTGTATDLVTITVRDAAASVIRVPADFATIQAALNAAPLHGLVLVSPGTYRENVVVPRTLTLASTYYTTGNPSLIDSTIISGPASGTDTVFVSAAAGSDTHVVGLTVRDGKDGIEVAGSAVLERNVIVSGSDAVDFPKGSTGLVHNNVMRQNGDDGVDLDQSTVVVTGNLMEGNAGDGIEARLTNHTAPLRDIVVRGNRILQSRQDGIQIIDDDPITTASGSATLVTIERNVIAASRQAGIGLMDGAQTSEDYRGASLVERILVANNTIDGNNHGLTGGDNLVAVNNVFAHQVGPALKNVDGASRVAYTQFFANGAANISSNVDAATSYNGDPMLDASYAPLPGSPVVDGGTSTYTLPSGELAVEVSDFLGAAPDLGAVESSGTAPSNRAPVVNAGPDLSVTLPATAALAGTATDDGMPAGSSLTSQWSVVSGPGTVTFADANAASTTASFSVEGDYTLRLTATDGELSTSDTVAVVVSPAGGGGGTTTTVQSSVAAGSDDAEESPSGSVSLSSGDLELVTDGNTVQTVGVRFTGVQVPRGAQVTAASVQFSTDEVSTDVAALTIRGQAADNAATFTTVARSVSSRVRTTAAVSWNPPSWSTVGARTDAQRTPNLAPVVQEVVNRAGWTSGNAMAFVVTGTGRRTADAFEDSPAPTLQITYSTNGGGGPTNTPPVVNAGADQSVTLPAAASLAGSVSDDGLPAGSTPTALWSVVSGPGTVTFADANAASTSATFSTAGPYELRLTGSDGELSASDTVSVTVAAAGGGGTVTVTEARVSAGNDDAEQSTSGSVNLTSSDLELTTDGNTVQTVGMRFPALAVPAGATVVRAWIQFSTDEATTAATNLTIAAQAADNAAAFVNTSGNLSSRPRTTATVPWTPPGWPTVGQRGVDQRTPDLVAPLQQVLSRPGWASGNAVAFLVTGTGSRVAVAFDGSGANAPVLHVEWRL